MEKKEQLLVIQPANELKFRGKLYGVRSRKLSTELHWTFKEGKGRLSTAIAINYLLFICELRQWLGVNRNVFPVGWLGGWDSDTFDVLIQLSSIDFWC